MLTQMKAFTNEKKSIYIYRLNNKKKTYHVKDSNTRLIRSNVSLNNWSCYTQKKFEICQKLSETYACLNRFHINFISRTNKSKIFRLCNRCGFAV